jgi:hypothetical protein
MATLYPFDTSSVLHDGTAKTTSGVGSVAYYDVGAAARFPAVAVISVPTLAAGTDETYDVIIEGAEATSFATARQLGSITIVRGEPGRYTILFDNDQGGKVYRYVRVRFAVTGTAPSIAANVYMAPLYPVS